MKNRIQGKRFWMLAGTFCTVMAVWLLSSKLASASIWDSIWSNAGGKETADFLIKYQDYLSFGNFFTIIFHSLGWLLVKGLFAVTKFVEGLTSETLGLLSFLDNAGVNSLTNAIITDLVVALMILVLVFLGFKTVIAKEPPNFKSVGVNVALSAFLILGLPTLMNMMEDISVKFYDSTQTAGNNDQISSLSWNLIQQNTTDLLYVSSNGFRLLADEGSKKNGMTVDSFKRTNLNALITPDTVSDVDGEEIKHLAFKLDSDENGDPIADEIKGGAFGFFTDTFDEGYFRYQVNFAPVIIGLLSLGVAYAFAIFVLVTTIIEIGIKKIVGLFVFATDLESGQRTKMVVQDILNAFLLIAFTGLSLKIYTTFLTYLAGTNIDSMIVIIAMVSATFVLIKGSSTIMRYFGVDVGVKEGFAQMAGAFALGRATAGGVKKLNDFGKKGNNGNGSNSSMDEARENLNGNGESFSSINKASQAKVKSGIAGMGTSVANSLKDKMPGKVEPIQSNAGTMAVAGLAGATAAGASQSSDQEKKKSLVNQDFKEALANKNAFSSLDKGQNVSEKERNQAQNGIQGAELGNGLQNSSFQRPEDLQNGLKGNQGEASINNGNGRGNQELITNTKLDDTMQPNMNSTQTPEDLRNGLRGNQGEASINDGKGRGNQELITNTKLDDAMQPNMKNSTGLMNMKAQMDGTPSGAEVTGAMKMAKENHDATGNLNMQTQDIQPSLNERSEAKTNQPSLNRNERLEAEMKLNSPGINQRSEMATDVKMNASDMASPSIANQSTDVKFNASDKISPNVADQSANVKFNSPNHVSPNMVTQSGDVKFNASDRVSPNVANQSAEVKFNPSGMNQRGEMTADMKMNPSSTNVSPVLTQAVQRVLQQVGGTNFKNPESAKQSIIQQVQQGSFGTNDQKQNIIQEITKSSTATPQQMQQNVQQVLSTARIPQEAQNVVQRVMREAQNGTSQPSETIKTRVVQELEKASFGAKEPIKQTIMQDVQKAFSATPQQMQQNFKQVLQQAEKSGSISSTEAQQTVKQVVEKKENTVTTGSSNINGSNYFGSLFTNPTNYQNEPVPKKSSRFDFITKNEGATE